MNQIGWNDNSSIHNFLLNVTGSEKTLLIYMQIFTTLSDFEI